MAIELLCGIIAHVEQHLVWPRMCSRLVFIMKRLGGVRPLGLLQVLCRLQCRLRRPLISAWQK
eukprot:1267551-Pyramimonas_sp.AAC.1